MITVQIDYSKATVEELTAFFAIPGMLDVLATINARGHELNIESKSVGGEGAVIHLMNTLSATLRPRGEHDEYHKLVHPANNAQSGVMTASIGGR